MTAGRDELGRELAALAGGPLDGRWYFRDELERMQERASQWAAIRASRCPDEYRESVQDYAPSERWAPNPNQRYGQGRVWLHTSRDRRSQTRAPRHLLVSGCTRTQQSTSERTER